MAKIEKEVLRFIKSYQKGLSYLWKVSIPNGHGGQIRKQGFLEKRDAVEFATCTYLKVLQQDKRLKISLSRVTFKEYSNQWLELKKRNGLSEAGFMRYEQEVVLRLIPYFGHFKMVDLEKTHLRNFIFELQSNNNGTSIVSVAVSIFKSIVRQAELDDVVTTKGILLIKTPVHKKREPQFWDQKQSAYFLNAMSGHKLHDLWKFTLFSGLRAGEVAGLKWDCVYLDKSFGSYTGAIEIKRTYNQKTRRMQETTKNGDRRIVPIFDEARKVLLKLSENRKGDFVFSGDEPLESSHFNRQLQTAIASLPSNQIPMISFHSLRHSFCSYLDATGMSRRVVAEIMGHRDLNTTNRYSHVNNQMLGDETSRWAKSQIQQKPNNLAIVNF